MWTHATTACKHHNHFFLLQAKHNTIEKRPAWAAAGADSKKKKQKVAAKLSESDEAVSTTNKDAPCKWSRVVCQASIFEWELDNNVLDTFSQLRVREIFCQAAPTVSALGVQQLVYAHIHP
jgi:hypothetical protein